MNLPFSSMRTKNFDYYLPKELIAQQPVSPRDSSRLLIVWRKKNSFKEDVFRNIGKYLDKQDSLILNNTKVIPARIFAQRKSGGKVELLLISQDKNNFWQAMVKPSSRLKVGEVVYTTLGYSISLEKRASNGIWLVKPLEVSMQEIMEKCGKMPTPPYIRKVLKDPHLYQTVYAKNEGAIAAPTAGLHFTEDLLNSLKEQGINIGYITLHVGIGTFKLIKSEYLHQHKMEKENYYISEETKELIEKTFQNKKRIIAVGTTVTRCLEDSSRKSQDNLISCGYGQADIFIYPGYKFSLINGLITNFHLPCSTTLVLAHAFAGSELIKRAYQYAIEKKFRFYSFGDAMLIL